VTARRSSPRLEAVQAKANVRITGSEIAQVMYTARDSDRGHNVGELTVQAEAREALRL